MDGVDAVLIDSRPTDVLTVLEYLFICKCASIDGIKQKSCGDEQREGGDRVGSCVQALSEEVQRWEDEPGS